jgi:hypothetical protein
VSVLQQTKAIGTGSCMSLHSLFEIIAEPQTGLMVGQNKSTCKAEPRDADTAAELALAATEKWSSSTTEASNRHGCENPFRDDRAGGGSSLQLRVTVITQPQV